MQRKVIARYHTHGPVTEKVTHQKFRVEKDAETKVSRLVAEEITEELECYYVNFPKGHSIRFTSLAKLKEHGFDKKPRLIDSETGDVIDVGGEDYDFIHEMPKGGGKSRTALAA